MCFFFFLPQLRGGDTLAWVSLSPLPSFFNGLPVRGYKMVTAAGGLHTRTLVASFRMRWQPDESPTRGRTSFHRGVFFCGCGGQCSLGFFRRASILKKHGVYQVIDVALRKANHWFWLARAATASAQQTSRVSRGKVFQTPRAAGTCTYTVAFGGQQQATQASCVPHAIAHAFHPPAVDLRTVRDIWTTCSASPRGPGPVRFYRSWTAP